MVNVRVVIELPPCVDSSPFLHGRSITISLSREHTMQREIVEILLQLDFFADLCHNNTS
jgi:hypothetical protein